VKLWLNGYFTSSAVVVVHRCRLSVYQIIIIINNVLISVMLYLYLHLLILPISSTDFLRKIYPQFTRCNIRILPLPALYNIWPGNSRSILITPQSAWAMYLEFTNSV